MDLSQRPEGSDGNPFPWKPIVICVAMGQFAIEACINYRQLQVLRRWNIESENESRAWDIKRTWFRIFSAFCSMLQIVVLIGLDIVPAVWRRTVETEAWLLKDTDRPHLWLSHDWDRSSIFMFYCYIAYLLINLPTYLYRTLVLKERVIRDIYYGRQNHNWVVRSIANGRPVASVLLFTGICALEFKSLKLKFDKNYGLGVGICQLLFVLFYPLLAQPKRKSLSAMEPGQMKDAIESLAAAAKFPVKTIYIIDDHFREEVQVFGLPRRKYIAIPKNMITECSTDDITGLVAHEMGSWKCSNGFKVFFLGQVYFNVAWIYLILFMNERSNYTSFGFEGESYPRMAAFVIFALAIAPIITAVMGVNMNNVERKNCFWADKFAVDLGYASALSSILLKKQTAEGSGDVDLWYSLYYNPSLALSERLSELAKSSHEKDVKEEGLISLSGDEKK